MESNHVLNKEAIVGRLCMNAESFKDFGVERIGLFGSYLRGEAGPASDIDLLVEFKYGQKNYKNFIRLAHFLQDLFNTKIDLLTNKALSPYIKPYIIKEVEYVRYPFIE